MELGSPFRAITPTLDGEVLMVLAGATAEFTPPEAQRLLGRYSVEGVRKVLVRLAEQGVVHARRVGNATLYQLNRDHLVAPAILQMARIKELLLERLSEEAGNWAVPCEYGALFGSAARGDMTPSSDIDLFVVRPSAISADNPEWLEQTTSLSRAVTAWTGNDARILEYGSDELVAASRGVDPVLVRIRRDGIYFVGTKDHLDRLLANSVSTEDG